MPTISRNDFRNDFGNDPRNDPRNVEMTYSDRPYWQNLSQNELSYFLPSRADGLNDMCICATFRASPTLVSPFRLRIVWAIMRLRHTLLACQIEMRPGRYDDARFIYTPPSSAARSLDQAGETLVIYDDKTGAELYQECLGGPRKLSAEHLSRLEIARQRVVPGLVEYDMMMMQFHAVSDGLSSHKHINMMMELLGGSATPGGLPRTDTELIGLLELEWRVRWGGWGMDEVIVSSTEARLPSPRTKFQEVAWKVDPQNIQRRFILGLQTSGQQRQVQRQTNSRNSGGWGNGIAISNSLDYADLAGSNCWEPDPKIIRVSSAKKNISVYVHGTIMHKVRQSMGALQYELAGSWQGCHKNLPPECKSQRTTIQNANFAWIRIEEDHPEFAAPKTLPIMMYTAVSLRRYLAPISPLSSYMSLALGYCNVVLPSFIPATADRHAVFWARSRLTQAQLRKYSRSPLLCGRSQIISAERGSRAKSFARQDDEADGTLPPSAMEPKAEAPASSGTFVDAISNVRKTKGGILIFTRTVQNRFSLTLIWDSVAYPPGIIEEFWQHFIGGVHEFIIDAPHSLFKL
ncbi:hypothetical protein B0H10DRAFT_2195551 [Mycena sp. CBHHK59/15]|nr:hypothetical protein B0H10DRAFT_2195551 [Mycena sp. CBHHK59/15]